MHRTRSFLAAAAVVFLAACSTRPTQAPTKTIPFYLLSTTGCAVVAGGDIGSQFADKHVTAMWTKINSAITTELHDRLVLNKYRAVKFLVPSERVAKAEDLVFENLARHRCNRVLQVAHKVDEDSSGKYFRFDVTLFRAQPKEDVATSESAVTIIATSEFQRSYRFARTQASFENFYTGTFAEKVLEELVAAGALAPLR